MRIHQPGASKFTQLSDVPSSYLGEANQHLAVNALETGIDFVTPGGGGVSSVVAGTGIAVDNTDPANPVVSATGGPGGFAITETEVNFGTTPVVEKTFTVTDAAITPTSKIIVTESGSIGTGRVASGDSLWDTITYACIPATGSFTLFAKASGSVVGFRKLFYSYS